MHLVGFLLTSNYDALNHELKIHIFIQKALNSNCYQELTLKTETPDHEEGSYKLEPLDLHFVLQSTADIMFQFVLIPKILQEPPYLFYACS